MENRTAVQSVPRPNKKCNKPKFDLLHRSKPDSRERGNGYAKPVRDYSIEIDSVGQTSAQEPHSVQAEASIT